MSINIRHAEKKDIPGILDIYRYYVEETAVSFEYDTPSLEEFTGRMEQTLAAGFPYLVLEEGEQILGYAYAGRFHPRKAYDHCCELTIYLEKSATHRGLGKTLYGALLEELRTLGYTNFYACIAVPHESTDPYLTRASEQFHLKLGFSPRGHFPGCGRKFGRLYDMIWCGIEEL